MRITEGRMRGVSTRLSGRAPRVWATRGVVLGVIVAALGLTLGTDVGRHQLALSFTRIPAPYVALYFPNDPPVSVDDDRLTATFAVADHEGVAKRYGYDVRVLDGMAQQLVESRGEVAVAADLVSTVSVDLNLPPGSGWARIDVNLVGRSEAIYYRAPPDDRGRNS